MLAERARARVTLDRLNDARKRTNAGERLAAIGLAASASGAAGFDRLSNNAGVARTIV